LAMLRAGKTYRQIERELQCARSTVAYHARRAELNKGRTKRIDWANVQALYDTGLSTVEAWKALTINRNTWKDAVSRGDLIVRPEHRFKGGPRSLEAVLETGDRGTIKKRLLREGILEEVCVICGIGPEWQGKPLVLRLDHINGVSDDYRIENLRLLCPNCDSQTDTYCGRNKRRVLTVAHEDDAAAA
jgi:hypothetical protein